MTDPGRLKFVDRECLAKLGKEQSPALSPGQSDRLVEETRCNLVPSLNGGKQDRLLIEHLGIEEQTIHVEDDGGWHVRELHRNAVRVGHGVPRWPACPRAHPARRHAATGHPASI